MHNYARILHSPAVLPSGPCRYPALEYADLVAQPANIVQRKANKLDARIPILLRITKRPLFSSSFP